MVDIKEKDKEVIGIFTLFILSILLTTIFIQGLWAIDIGASALSSGIENVEGLYGSRTASEHYHLGLVTAVIAFVGVLGMAGFAIIVWVFR